MDEFVKQQSIRERLMRHHHIAERDRSHGGLIGQIVEAQALQHRVEIWVAYSLSPQDEEPSAVQNLRREKPL
jgi:hypothetical protein